MSSPNAKENASDHRMAGLVMSCMIGFAIVGFFVGITDGVPIHEAQSLPRAPIGPSTNQPTPDSIETKSNEVIAAVHYAKMRRGEQGPTSRSQGSLRQIPQPKYDRFSEIKQSQDDKQRSIHIRASRRAYRGAPPIIPHAVEGTNDAACYACHNQGIYIDGKIANRMCHPFLANCTQCHAVPPPPPFKDLDKPVQNHFVGLPEPLEGKRANPNAPPEIPHSTFMRNKCLTCHGSPLGWIGLQSTHPWRTACTQCHVLSAVLNQDPVSATAKFLPKPNMQVVEAE